MKNTIIDFNACSSPQTISRIKEILFIPISMSVPALPKLLSTETVRGKSEQTSLDFENSSMSLSEAQHKLYLFQYSGFLYKKGFKYFKFWRKRFFTLHGRRLSYFVVSHCCYYY